MPRALSLENITLREDISSFDQYGSAPVSKRLQTVQLSSALTGSAMKGWKRKIMNGENATTNMSAYEQRLLSKESYKLVMGSTPQSGYIYSGDYVLGGPYYSPVNFGKVKASVDNAARAKAFSGMRAGFNSATFRGELSQSISMIANPARAARNQVNGLISKNRRSRDSARTVKQYRKAIAGSVLEFQFGWKPLAMDIQSAYSAYLRQREEKSTIPFKGTYRQTVNAPPVPVGSTGVNGACRAVHTAKVEVSVSYQGAVRLKVGTPRSAFNFGSTFPDFIPAAWELMPWSFLIDYFTNVGEVLNSAATAAVVNFVYCSKTSRVVVETTARLQPSPPVVQGYTVREYERGAATWYSKEISRSDVGTIPLPSLQLSTDLSSGQAMNIAALIAQGRSDGRFSKR